MSANRKNGFTLIEIILVLALASILLLMIFTALSGAQRARRDAQRKRDLVEFYGKLEEYSANNQDNKTKLCPISSVNDQFPCDQPSLSAFTSAYFSGHKDPLTGSDYVITYWENTHNRRPDPGEILYGREHICMVNSDDKPNDIINDHINGKPTDFYHDHYMMVYQENGEYYCLDNRIK